MTIRPEEAIPTSLERVKAVVLEAVPSTGGLVGSNLAAALAALTVGVGPVLYAFAVDVAGDGLAVGGQGGCGGQEGAGEVEGEVHGAWSFPGRMMISVVRQVEVDAVIWLNTWNLAFLYAVAPWRPGVITMQCLSRCDADVGLKARAKKVAEGHEPRD